MSGKGRAYQKSCWVLISVWLVEIKLVQTDLNLDMPIVVLKGWQLFNAFAKHEVHLGIRKTSKPSIFKDVLNNENNAVQEKKNMKADNKIPKSNDNLNSVVKSHADDEGDFSDQLIKWAIQNNISYLAFSKLLKVLTEYGIKGLPKNSKELLKAKEDKIKVFTVPPGTYTHFGLAKNLTNLIMNLTHKNLFNQTEIHVSVFIDQLLLAKFTQRSLWVILGSVVGFTNCIFFIGTYHGYSRPKDPNLFVSQFVNEAKNLCTKGLEINNKIHNVKIKRLICDAPAKAFVLNIKDFKGYSSCTKCNTVGEYKSKKICFLEKSTPRKNEDFEKNEMYLHAKTNLLEIPNFGVVTNVPLDYMHLVCLGVVQKLLSIWLTNENHWICQSSAFDMIRNLALLYPCEFDRKPKSFKIYTRWSANDFRQFLLYYGPAVLQNNLKEKYYNHFLLLHVACRLLCSNDSLENIECGRKLLNDFVENYHNLYSEQITHNVHGLYHLADECAFHGTLDSFSAFPFEKFLVKLRNSMRRTRKKNLPQTVLKESYENIFTKSLDQLTTNNYKVFKKLKIANSEKFQNFFHYEKLSIKNFDIIPSTKGDKYVILKSGKIIEVTNILEQKEKSKKIHMVAGREFFQISNFHSEPFEDLQLNMFKVGKYSDAVDLWPIDMIDKKCMKIPLEKDESIMVGLLIDNF